MEHRSLKMTEHYAHLASEAKRTAALEVEGILRERLNI